jgi:hypothetical protein
VSGLGQSTACDKATLSTCFFEAGVGVEVFRTTGVDKVSGAQPASIAKPPAPRLALKNSRRVMPFWDDLEVFSSLFIFVLLRLERLALHVTPLRIIFALKNDRQIMKG